jgi:hypothetical protein
MRGGCGEGGTLGSILLNSHDLVDEIQQARGAYIFRSTTLLIV